MLIVAPDKSMTLCSDETNIYLFGSHLHQNYGALVAHCKKASKAEFRNYVGSMLQRSRTLVYTLILVLGQANGQDNRSTNK